MNIPLNTFKRDELYTFISGIVTSSAWYLYFQGINIVKKDTFLKDPIFLLTWLSSTALIYIIYLILSYAIVFASKKKLETQDDEKEFKKMKLKKHLSFFYSSHLEENQISSHILGLITVSLILIYHPLFYYITKWLNFSNFIIIHIAYTLFVLVVYSLFFKNLYYLLKVNSFISKNYCDILDQKIYIQERAIYYARIKNDEFLNNLKNQNQKEKS